MIEDSTTAAPVPRWAAGRVVSGADASVVHLIGRPGDTGAWRTACSDGGRGGNRVVAPSLELIDCAGCHAAQPTRAGVVNLLVGEQLSELSHARTAAKSFLEFAAADGSVDDGGAVLAVYAGGTRLVPVHAGEREKLLDRWLEGLRRYP